MEQNEELQEQILQVVENQLDAGDPPETQETLDRLKNQGYSENDAKKLIGMCVGNELYDMLQNQEKFNQERFIKNLKNLPTPPYETQE